MNFSAYELFQSRFVFRTIHRYLNVKGLRKIDNLSIFLSPFTFKYLERRKKQTNDYKQTNVYVLFSYLSVYLLGLFVSFFFLDI